MHSIGVHVHILRNAVDKLARAYSLKWLHWNNFLRSNASFQSQQKLLFLSILSVSFLAFKALLKKSVSFTDKLFKFALLLLMTCLAKHLLINSLASARIQRFSQKNSSFRLPYQRPSSSADCARELFNGSASLVDCIRKTIFCLGGADFLWVTS